MMEKISVIKYQTLKKLKSLNINCEWQKSDTNETSIIIVDANHICKIIEFFKTQSDVKFDILLSVSSVDFPEHFEVSYHLLDSTFKNQIIIKASLSKENPTIESIANIYSAANWHERENYDLMGIKFKNHPDLKRILLTDDWQGHPLRKDYVQNDERLIWNQR